MLADRYGVAIDTAALAVDLAVILPQPLAFGNVPEQREAFEVLTDWVRRQGEIPDDHETLAELRETAMANEVPRSAELEMGHSATPEGSDEAATGDVMPLMLDTEVVGIYW